MRLRDLANLATGTNVATFGKKQVDSDAIRPESFDSFIGQSRNIEILRMAVKAATVRGGMPDHVLLTGPGGLGKTTVALIIANEIGGQFDATTAPMLNVDNLVKLFTAAKPRSVIFIDEIHMISPKVREVLYAALEDGWLDTTSVQGVERIKLPPFTLVGATTLPGRLPDSFKDRFGLPIRLDYYSVPELEAMAYRTAERLDLSITQEGAEMLADRSKLVPRVLNSRVARVRDYLDAMREPDQRIIDESACSAVFALHGIDGLGLDKLDRDILKALRYRFNCSKVGVEQLSIAVGEDMDTIRNEVEPWLLRCGLMTRSPSGRQITTLGKDHIEGEDRQEPV